MELHSVQDMLSKITKKHLYECRLYIQRDLYTNITIKECRSTEIHKTYYPEFDLESS